MNTKEIREKADELEQKLQSLIDDFQKEVNPHEIDVSFIYEITTISQGRKVVHHSVKVEVKI